MLDQTTKRRIDTARQILVGKVPDPKSQIEQITLALIYKFMNDTDNLSREIGGKPSYFIEEYAHFSWDNIIDTRLSGQERMNRYTEGLERRARNPHLPELFRNIFKNACLPFRDPRTLNMFLEVINEFEYDHSERLGDAYEYLLSIMSSQGDAGQFRTPRHIIDFIVRVVDPSIDDSILDPACGTAGFLISAIKHIIAANTKDVTGDLLNIDQRKKLYDNVKGYDISGDMVRMSLVNMFLNGITQPHIDEYDTLTSTDKWDDNVSCVLANPPFMSPKGGIKPHNRFSIQSKRSEVLFVDYIMEHLTPTGKGGVIVPEGIIFQSQNSYKELRRKMVDEGYLWAVVSLPSGVFNPYSGVKTSILFFDRAIAKRTDEILFVKVDADGYDLGAQRKPTKDNDLPEAEKALKHFKQHHRLLPEGERETNYILVDDKGTRLSDGQGNCLVWRDYIAHTATRKEIAAEDYNLSASRYVKEEVKEGKWPHKTVEELCSRIFSGGTPSTKNSEYWNGNIPWISSADIIDMYTAIPRRFVTDEAIRQSSTKIVPAGNIIVVTRVGLGKLFITDRDLCISQDSQGLILKQELVNPQYMLHMMARRVDEFKEKSQGTTISGVTKKQLATISIPLPPLDVQREIVEEIEGYQKSIEEARNEIARLEKQISERIARVWEE